MVECPSLFVISQFFNDLFQALHTETEVTYLLAVTCGRANGMKADLGRWAL
jgi:hypothetical protein